MTEFKHILDRSVRTARQQLERLARLRLKGKVLAVWPSSVPKRRRGRHGLSVTNRTFASTLVSALKGQAHAAGDLDGDTTAHGEAPFDAFIESPIAPQTRGNEDTPIK